VPASDRAGIAAFDPDALARGHGKIGKHVRGNRLPAGVVERGGGAFGIDPRLIAGGLERGDPLLEIGVVQIGDTRFNGVE